MKKNLLLVSLLAMSMGVSAQFNWLQNSDFEAADKTLERVESYKTVEAGNWAAYAQAGQDAFTAELVKDEADASHGQVVKLTGSSKVSWYKAYLMQVPAYALKAEEYILKFDAKLVEGSDKLAVLIYTADEKFVAKSGFDPTVHTKASGARYDQALKEEWATYEVKFNFAKKVNNVNSPEKVSDYSFTDTQVSDLAACRIVFNTNAKNLTYLIDNIQLIPVNPATKPDGVDPEPPVDPEQPDVPEVPADPEFPAYQDVTAEGDFLKDGSFDVENDTIQVWRTLDKAKYLGDFGHWYFYNETKEGVHPFASRAAVVDAGDSHGKVVALINGEKINSWWGHDLLQRVGVIMEPMTYRVSFYARSNSGAKVKFNLSLKKKDDLKGTGYALIDGFIPEEHPKSSGTTPQFAVTTEWQMYETVFDLSKMAETIWSLETSDKILPVEDEELLKNVYLAIWNETANSTLEIDDVVIEPVATYQTIQNAGFETNTLLPVMNTVEDAPLGMRSGQWVVVNKREGKMTLGVDEATASEGNRSLKMEFTAASRYPRIDQYMAMDLYEVSAGTYQFSFDAKTSQEGAPVRLDAYVYTDITAPEFMAITGENGDKYEVVGNVDKGLNRAFLTTEWSSCKQVMTLEENAMVRLFIRPNIDGLGAAGLWEDLAFPVTYWFDNFKLEKYVPEVSVDANGVADVQIAVVENGIQLAGLDNAQVTVCDVNGTLVSRIENAEGQAACSLMSGAYIVRVVSAQGVQTVKVLVK